MDAFNMQLTELFNIIIASGLLSLMQLCGLCQRSTLDAQSAAGTMCEILEVEHWGLSLSGTAPLTQIPHLF
jgi:hypothetical protein